MPVDKRLQMYLTEIGRTFPGLTAKRTYSLSEEIIRGFKVMKFLYRKQFVIYNITLYRAINIIVLIALFVVCSCFCRVLLIVI